MNPWIIIIPAIVILFLLGAYIFLIAPGKKRNMTEFKNVKFAHRGLHDAKYPENSLSAFGAAVEAGFGIELDVRLSSDGVLMVFHDDTLLRVCGDERRVIDLTAAELSAISLLGTPDTVPTFAEVLSLVDGRVPLLVEIKESAGDGSVSAKTIEMLKDYKGTYIVESFNPFSVKKAKDGLPATACGILATGEYGEADKGHSLRNFALTHLLTNVICRPSFVAYDARRSRCFTLKMMRFLGVARVAWTIRSPKEERAALKAGFDTVIFENYIPEK